MENLQPHQILVPLAIALVLGVLVLVWGDRPGLAAALRARFAPSDDETYEDELDQPPAERRQPPPPARFEVKHFAPYVAPASSVPVSLQNEGNARSNAAEPDREQPGTADGNSVPDLVAQLEQLSDEALLDILARVKTPAGEDRSSAASGR